MLATFRDLSLIEGLSLITLFFIAMPAKYAFGVPVSHHYKWSLLKWLAVLLAGFIPFACFVLDRQLRRGLG